MIYSELAQEIIHKFVSTLQVNADSKLETAVNEALQDLVTGFNADQGLVWLITGDRLTVTNAYSVQNEVDPIGLNLNPQNGTILVLNFLSAGNSSIEVDRTSADWEPLLKVSQEFDSLLVVALKARDIFPGFLALQSEKKRQWSTSERSTLEQVAAFLSVIFSYELDLRKFAVQ